MGLIEPNTIGGTFTGTSGNVYVIWNHSDNNATNANEYFQLIQHYDLLTENIPAFGATEFDGIPISNFLDKVDDYTIPETQGTDFTKRLYFPKINDFSTVLVDTGMVFSHMGMAMNLWFASLNTSEETELENRYSPRNKFYVLQKKKKDLGIFEKDGKKKYSLSTHDTTKPLSFTLKKGVEYTFNFSTDHPLKLSTTPDGTHSDGGVEYTTGVDTDTDGKLVFTVPADAPDKLYFYCESHENMGGKISILPEGSPFLERSFISNGFSVYLKLALAHAKVLDIDNLNKILNLL